MISAAGRLAAHLKAGAPVIPAGAHRREGRYGPELEADAGIHGRERRRPADPEPRVSTAGTTSRTMAK